MARLGDVTRVIAPYHFAIGGRERELVARALDDGHLTTNTSRMINEYESALAEYFGAEHCVAFSSGTAALHAALASVDVGPGSEVILPPTAPVMTVLPILHQNAAPVFVDTRPGLFDLDPAALGAALTPRTAAVVSVPLWGYPTDDAGVREVTDRAGVPLIVDASQLHGSRLRGKLCGTHGVIGCFSTYESKLIGTGEGGFAITDDAHVAGAMREVLNFGSPYRAGSYWPGCNRIGWNYKCNALAAALGLGQLASLDRRIARRGRVRLAVEAGLARVPGVGLHPLDPLDTHNGYALVLHISHPDARSRAAVVRWIVDGGIPSDTVRYAYAPLYERRLFQHRLGYGDTSCPFECQGNPRLPPARCPNAEELIGRVTTLPCHEALSDADIAYIVDVVEAAVLQEGSRP